MNVLAFRACCGNDFSVSGGPEGQSDPNYALAMTFLGEIPGASAQQIFE
jgi:hypothetical protein